MTALWGGADVEILFAWEGIAYGVVAHFGLGTVPANVGTMCRAGDLGEVNYGMDHHITQTIPNTCSPCIGHSSADLGQRRLIQANMCAWCWREYVYI